MENDELAQHLDSLKREDCYRVDAVLKESSHETTQRVYFMGENGAETGPYIRKFIRQDPGMGAVYERIFEVQREGRRFKYLPDILECYARDGLLVVVMECVRGETLQDTVYRTDPSLELAADIFPRLCDAVGELHDEFNPPIIHRDLKPSNIILSEGGLAIIDFGIAREFKDDSDRDTSRFGTRGFAPPEQFGFGQTTVRSDVYSLGMVLYYCLTESIPNNAVRERGFSDPRIPGPIRQVIIKATAFDPNYRFESVAELKGAFLTSLAQDAHKTLNGISSIASDGNPGSPNADKSENADATPSPGNKPRKTVLAVALAACVIVGVAAVFAAVGLPGQESSPTNTSAVSQQVSQGSSEAGNAQSTSTDDSDANDATGNEAATVASTTIGVSENSEAVEQAAEAVSIDAPKKNAYDPKTNFKVTVAGVDYQVPRYFKTKTMVNETASYYYAETGSSTAMIMTKETPIDGDPSDEDIFSLYDSFLEGVKESNEAFDNFTIVADCDLAGYPARIATFTGAIKGVPIKSEIAFFYNSSAGAIGAIIFGQTENAQFDYRDDFAKVITSAAPHE